MEAVNSVVNAASKAIWGEPTVQSGQEPISGEQGAGTADKPYDRGNEGITPPATDNTTNTFDAAPAVDSTSDISPTMNTTDTSDTPPSVAGAGSGLPGSKDSHTDISSRSGDIRPSEAGENQPHTTAGGVGVVSSSAGVPPSSGGTSDQKHEGADRPREEPNTEETEALKEKKDSAEHAQSQDYKPIKSEDERQELAAKGKLPHDPDDHSGEPLKMHGENEESKAKDRTASVAHEGGGEHGKAKGTGEEYIKSTGLAADGGDFDATKPGAGREANRLLEEKGIHKDSAGKQVGNDDSSQKSGEGKKKESKMGRLKEKLHIGTGKNLG